MDVPVFADDVPAAERCRILATEVRAMARDLADFGEPWEDRRAKLSGIADLLDGDSVECLRFSRRRAGNPKAKSQIGDILIALEAASLYKEYVAQGRSRRGLKKQVSDEVGKRRGKKGSTIDRLWQVPPRGDSPPSTAPEPNASPLRYSWLGPIFTR
jgi:hypothetical protein